MKRISLFKVFMHETAGPAVAEVLRSGYVGQGPRVDEFEGVLREHFDCPWVNTLNSATSGLELAVHMLKNENPDAEILTTPLTCTATNFAILAAGVKLRWVDVDPCTGNMCMEDLARSISDDSLAIMVVHWGGYPCDLDHIRDLQAERAYDAGSTIPVIEDCAHAWGATYKGKLIGTHGNTCVFSFQAIKHLTTGDGGCMVSPDEEHYQRARLLRWYGLDRDSGNDFRCRQNVKEWGFKFHMNDIAAAIGSANYPHVSDLVDLHRSNGLYYDDQLANVPGLLLMERRDDRESSFWVYTARVEDREGFVRKMAEKGITVSQVHRRNDEHACLKEYRRRLPNLDLLSKQIICLPCGWWVTNEDREYIVDSIKEGW